MVKIVNFKSRINQEGEEFFSLIVDGGVELVKTKTGNYYCTSKQASVPCTFDEETCRELIGHSLPGQVTKVSCEPFEFTNKNTGEHMCLDYRWSYIEEEPSNVYEQDKALI